MQRTRDSTFGLRIAALEPANLFTGRIAKLSMTEVDLLSHITLPHALF
jgi:hypothetical protein